MDSNHKLDFKYLLDQILSDELSNVDKNELMDYIQSTFKDHDLDLLMREHWLSLEHKDIIADDTKLQILKNRIISRINQLQASPSKVLRLFPFSWKNNLIRAAAVLFIPLLLSSLFVFYRMDRQINQLATSTAVQQVIASPGSRVHFMLPDQTEVWLNSGSTLEFPLALNFREQRKVKLLGQGYFKVAHDAKHPFLVEIQGLNIRALGTSFDVSNYADDKQISSTLEEGSIALINLQGDELARLVPGQKVILNKVTNKMAVKNVDTSLSTSWKDGKLIFRNASLSDVASQLERWYNCKIHVQPRLLNSDLMYTATIQDETLGEVLRMIEISTSVKTKIEKREVYIESKN